MRFDKRENNQLRPISIEGNIAPHAAGSVLIRFGNTQVICAASVENRLPSWMKQQGVTGGWITAEYSMLPYSTHERKQRDISKGRLDGRTVEIQRLIGRALRAVTDLQKLPDISLTIDCDVLQADGGTRTASITGAYIAAEMAIRRLISAGKLAESPFTHSVAAVSVGILDGIALLDLNYEEDRNAEVDCNVIMTGDGRLVEIQSAGEEATFSKEQLAQMMDLAEGGIQQLFHMQKTFLDDFQKSLPIVR
jgi:ribonuclease PH